MDLNLILDEVPENNRLDFCTYIINELKSMFEKAYDPSRVIKLEEYLNSHITIQQQIFKPTYYSVHDLYRIALENLNIKQLNEFTYRIEIDRNVVIPNSYNTLYSVISLFEFGTLSVKKYGLLSQCMETIADNLTTYYTNYLGAQ